MVSTHVNVSSVDGVVCECVCEDRCLCERQWVNVCECMFMDECVHVSTGVCLCGVGAWSLDECEGEHVWV